MKKYQLHLLSIVAIALAAGISAHAQIIGQIEANIPFQFHAGNAKFPAGKYILRVEQGSDLGTMEIQSYDGHSSALFEIRDAQAPTSPKKTELIFNHVGNRYFLSKIFDQEEQSRKCRGRYRLRKEVRRGSEIGRRGAYTSPTIQQKYGLGWPDSRST